jgi:hypothetical protein
VAATQVDGWVGCDYRVFGGNELREFFVPNQRFVVVHELILGTIPCQTDGFSSWKDRVTNPSPIVVAFRRVTLALGINNGAIWVDGELQVFRLSTDCTRFGDGS